MLLGLSAIGYQLSARILGTVFVVFWPIADS